MSESEEQLKLYADFNVIVKDTDGDIIQQQSIQDSGSFTIEDIKRNAILKDIDEIEVIPKAMETRRGDTTEFLVEPDE